MAVSPAPTVLEAATSTGTDAVSFLTASVSPTAGRYLTVFCEGRNGAAAVTLPVVASGLNGTWTEISGRSGGQRRLSIFGCPDASGTGQITITFQETIQFFFWAVVEWADVDLAAPALNDESGAGTGTGVNNGSANAVAPAAFADSANNVGVVVVSHNASEASAAADSFTEITDTNAAYEQNTGFAVYYKVGEDTSPDAATWVTSSAWRAVFVELRAQRHFLSSMGVGR